VASITPIQTSVDAKPFSTVDGYGVEWKEPAPATANASGSGAKLPYFAKE
jgi:hypothetical protein